MFDWWNEDKRKIELLKTPFAKYGDTIHLLVIVEGSKIIIPYIGSGHFQVRTSSAEDMIEMAVCNNYPTKIRDYSIKATDIEGYYEVSFVEVEEAKAEEVIMIKSPSYDYSQGYQPVRSNVTYPIPLPLPPSEE